MAIVTIGYPIATNSKIPAVIVSMSLVYRTFPILPNCYGTFFPMPQGVICHLDVLIRAVKHLGINWLGLRDTGTSTPGLVHVVE